MVDISQTYPAYRRGGRTAPGFGVELVLGRQIKEINPFKNVHGASGLQRRKIKSCGLFGEEVGNGRCARVG